MKKQALQTTLTVKEIEEMLNIRYWNLRRKEIVEEHLNVINAVYERDVEKAINAIELHLSNVKQNIIV